MRTPLPPGSIIRWRDREATIVHDTGFEKMTVYSPRLGNNVTWSWIMKGDCCDIVSVAEPSLDTSPEDDPIRVLPDPHAPVRTRLSISSYSRPGIYRG